MGGMKREMKMERENIIFYFLDMYVFVRISI